MPRKYEEGLLNVIFQDGMDYYTIAGLAERHGENVIIVNSVFGTTCTIKIPPGSKEYWKKRYNWVCPKVLKVVDVPKMGTC